MHNPLFRARQLIALFALKFIPSNNKLINLTPLVLKLAGFSEVSASSRIYPDIKIKGVRNLTIGDHTYIGANVEIVGAFDSRVVIGERCDISDHVSIVTGSHQICSAQRRAGRGISKNVEIKSGTWVGYRSTLLPGVVVGSGCIIGASSVVTKSIPDNVIAAGNPAAIIKRLTP